MEVLVVLQLAWVHTSPQLSWITMWGLTPSPEYQGSCGIVPYGPAGFVVSFNIHLELKCNHVASTPTLTMWLLYFNCTPLWTNKFFGEISKTDTVLCLQHSLLDQRPSSDFFCKMHKFLRFLAEYLVALAFLYCYYIFKAWVHYFHQIFIFSPTDSPSKTMKNYFDLI